MYFCITYLGRYCSSLIKYTHKHRLNRSSVKIIVVLAGLYEQMILKMNVTHEGHKEAELSPSQLPLSPSMLLGLKSNDGAHLKSRTFKSYLVRESSRQVTTLVFWRSLWLTDGVQQDHQWVQRGDTLEPEEGNWWTAKISDLSLVSSLGVGKFLQSQTWYNISSIDWHRKGL